MKTTPIKVDPWEGQIILLSKNHYSTTYIDDEGNIKDIDYLLALKRIWEVKCGLPAKCLDDDVRVYEHIGIFLFNLLNKTLNKNGKNIMSIIHHQLTNKMSWIHERDENLKPIEFLIQVYMSELGIIQIKELDDNGEYYDLITLPPKIEHSMNRIITGECNNTSETYKEICELEY